MFHVWALDYASVDEVAKRLGVTEIKADKLLAPLALGGILNRVRVDGRWYYSIDKEWVKTNPDIHAIMEAVDYLKESKGP